jgi:hypothetical protein
MKFCDCGESSGQYINNLDAEFSGNATMIGFNNSQFLQALRTKGSDFLAFTIKEPCQTFKRKNNAT